MGMPRGMPILYVVVKKSPVLQEGESGEPGK
jgi:hypothetical protein